MKKHFLLNAISIAFVLALAACKGQTATQATSAAPVMPATTAATEAPKATIAATETAVPATAAPTIEPSVDTTAASTAAALPDVKLTAIFATFCRTNPDDYSTGVGYLAANAEVKALGRTADNQYFYLENPDSPGTYCWIWNDYVMIDGLAYDLPVIDTTK
jgi:hypothetical protein